MVSTRIFLQTTVVGAIAGHLLGPAGRAQANPAAAAQAPAAKPNILFVLMDNLGYGELGSYGAGVLRGAPTARIDRLAIEGTRLTNFNVEAQCTPSRSAILTGRFAIRSGTHSVPLPGSLDGLTQWEMTLAETLSAVSPSRTGRPLVSTIACILLVSPPRDRPMDCFRFRMMQAPC